MYLIELRRSSKMTNGRRASHVRYEQSPLPPSLSTRFCHRSNRVRSLRNRQIEIRFFRLRISKLLSAEWTNHLFTNSDDHNST